MHNESLISGEKSPSVIEERLMMIVEILQRVCKKGELDESSSKCILIVEEMIELNKENYLVKKALFKHDDIIADNGKRKKCYDTSWVLNGEYNRCMRCDGSFNYFLLNTVHHCRLCGFTVCDRCSKQRVKLPELNEKGGSRVCYQCKYIFDHDQSQKRTFASFERSTDINEIIPSQQNTTVNQQGNSQNSISDDTKSSNASSEINSKKLNEIINANVSERKKTSQAIIKRYAIRHDEANALTFVYFFMFMSIYIYNITRR